MIFNVSLDVEIREKPPAVSCASVVVEKARSCRSVSVSENTPVDAANE